MSDRDRKAKVALALALGPGLLGAAAGGAAYPILVIVLICQVVLALLLAELRGGVWPKRPIPDALAWTAAWGSMICVTFLSSPQPHWLGSPTPGRRTVLAILAVVGTAALAYVLSSTAAAEPPEPDPEPAPPSPEPEPASSPDPEPAPPAEPDPQPDPEPAS